LVKLVTYKLTINKIKMKELDEVIKHLEFILDITESDLTDDIKNLKFVKKELEVLNLPH